MDMILGKSYFYKKPCFGTKLPSDNINSTCFYYFQTRIGSGLLSDYINSTCFYYFQTRIGSGLRFWHKEGSSDVDDLGINSAILPSRSSSR